MALFVMILRKMIQNKWLVASLFFGILLSVALVSTIPLYSEANLSRMLVKDLESFQAMKGVYPGTYFTQVRFTDESEDQRVKIVSDIDAIMRNKIADRFGIPVQELITEKKTTFPSLVRAGTRPELSNMHDASVTSVSGLHNHIHLVDGRMPNSNPVGGVYEVLVTPATMSNYNFVIGSEFELRDGEGKLLLRLRPVGEIKPQRNHDPFFRTNDLSFLDNTFLMDDQPFEDAIVAGKKASITQASWHFILDYSKLELRNVKDFLKTDKLVKSMVVPLFSLPVQSTFEVPAAETINGYFDRANRLTHLMWSLNVPVLTMLGFYMFMVSNLIVGHQKNEIAVLRSRGASRWQIFASFSIEGLLLSGAALLAGPFIGLALTTVLGASNGFLQFVQRTRLPVHLSLTSYAYGAVAAAVSLVMILIPVWLATRVSIVGHKQQSARLQKLPLWHKAFLDVLLLGLSLYGLMNFQSRLEDIRSLGLYSDDLRFDPMQFIVPSLFIIGGGLLLLRLYPYFLRITYVFGRKWWPPTLYATLIQVGRSNSQYQYLMIFLIITIATGIFSAGAARTINSNTEERIRYANGTDITFQTDWPSNMPPFVPPKPGEKVDVWEMPKEIYYSEPPFELYRELHGVESVAKVFIKNDASFTAGQSSGTAKLVGIDTDDFGRTAWTPDHLLPYSLNSYLNLMAADSRAVLISKTLADQKKVNVGDTIEVGWGNIPNQPFVVYGIIDYFPTFNPNPPTGTVNAANSKTKSNDPMLIVGHLSRIQFQLALLPYETWLKLEPNATSEMLYQSMKENKVKIVSLNNTNDQLILAKNDSFLMALNGELTLGFLISILVTFFGFLLYWMLSLKGRTLQNGVMRAIGVTFRQLLGMLALEQLLTSGVALLIGILLGNVAGHLFVPNFQIAFNPSSLVPPFQIRFEIMDFVRMYIIVGIMLILGLFILGCMLSRIRIHQALKLGED